MPSACDVVGCNASAARTYLDASDAQLLEFGVCPAHYLRLQKGPKPVIVAQQVGLSDEDGHPALLLD